MKAKTGLQVFSMLLAVLLVNVGVVSAVSIESVENVSQGWFDTLNHQSSLSFNTQLFRASDEPPSA